MKKISLGFISPFFLLASGDSMVPYSILGGFIIIIGLFFWGIYKAIKTQKTTYMLALIPFIVLIAYMFIR